MHTNNHSPHVVLRLCREYFGTHVSKTYSWRIGQLEALGRLVSENEDAIQAAVASDLGKPSFEGKFAEVWTVAGEVAATISALKSWMKPQSVSTPLALLPAKSYIVSEPFGVVLIISPFNYPVQLALMPLCAAIAAGNVAVIKPSELTPASSAILAKLIPKYMDNRAFRVVEGAIPETTALLKQKWDLIFFTGSEMVGKIVQKAAAETLTPTVLELGGKSPTIIDSNVGLELAVKRTLWGKLLNAGQTCIAPDYVYIDNKVKAKFFDLAAKQLTAFYGSDAKASGHLAKIVAPRHVERLVKILEQSKGEVKIGGEYDLKSRYVAPTILDCKSTKSYSMNEEIFGPILPVIGYDDINEVIDYINDNPKPLALYVFSNSSKFSDEVIRRTSSGAVVTNDTLMHFTNPELPFGGVGSSGLGSYHGRFGFEAFSHKKPVLEKATWGDAPGMC